MWFFSKPDNRVSRKYDELRSLLEEYTPPDNAELRIEWLVQHIRVYTDRWRGFCDLERITVSAIIGGDLHAVVLAAIRIINEEVSRFHAGHLLHKEWSAFQQLFLNITSDTPKSVVLEIDSAMSRVEREFEAGTQMRGIREE